MIRSAISLIHYRTEKKTGGSRRPPLPPGFVNRDDDIFPEYCRKRILILGCGNRLFGDDGFGPAVIDYLSNHYHIPDDLYLMDVGTGVRKILFTLCMSDHRPEQIVFIDAVDKGKIPGELFEISLDEIPFQKTDDFSLHQAPSSNLAKELKDHGLNIRVLACQTASIPSSMEIGLSDRVSAAVHTLSRKIAEEFL